MPNVQRSQPERRRRVVNHRLVPNGQFSGDFRVGEHRDTQRRQIVQAQPDLSPRGSYVFGKLVKNGAVSDTEANRLIGNMHSGLQSNRDAALDELSQLMNGKIEGVSQKYFNATGRAIPRSMYSPATQALMAKYNVGAASDAAATPTPGAPAPQPVAAPPAPAGSAVTQVPLPHVQALRNKYGYAPSN